MGPFQRQNRWESSEVSKEEILFQIEVSGRCFWCPIQNVGCRLLLLYLCLYKVSTWREDLDWITLLRYSCRSPIDHVVVLLSLVSVQVNKMHEKTLSILDWVWDYLVKANFQKRIWIREFLRWAQSLHYFLVYVLAETFFCNKLHAE